MELPILTKILQSVKFNLKINKRENNHYNLTLKA